MDIFCSSVGSETVMFLVRQILKIRITLFKGCDLQTPQAKEVSMCNMDSSISTHLDNALCRCSFVRLPTVPDNPSHHTAEED